MSTQPATAMEDPMFSYLTALWTTIAMGLESTLTLVVNAVAAVPAAIANLF